MKVELVFGDNGIHEFVDIHVSDLQESKDRETKLILEVLNLCREYNEKSIQKA